MLGGEGPVVPAGEVVGLEGANQRNRMTFPLYPALSAGQCDGQSTGGSTSPISGRANAADSSRTGLLRGGFSAVVLALRWTNGTRRVACFRWQLLCSASQLAQFCTAGRAEGPGAPPGGRRIALRMTVTTGAGTQLATSARIQHATFGSRRDVKIDIVLKKSPGSSVNFRCRCHFEAGPLSRR